MGDVIKWNVAAEVFKLTGGKRVAEHKRGREDITR